MLILNFVSCWAFFYKDSLICKLGIFLCLPVIHFCDHDAYGCHVQYFVTSCDFCIYFENYFSTLFNLQCSAQLVVVVDIDIDSVHLRCIFFQQ